MIRSKRRVAISVAVLLSALGGSPPAHADEPNPYGKSAAPTEADMAEARKAFDAGVALLEDPEGAKYEEAYRSFQRAYELSQSPKVLGNIGFCAFHMERDGEAIDSYTAYLHDVPDISERERAQIQRDLATLNTTVATVRFTVKRQSNDAVVLVDKRSQTRGPAVENAYPFPNEELKLRVRPGRHSFHVKAGNLESESFDTTIEPASTVTHEFVVRKEEPRSTPSLQPRLISPSLAGPIIVGTAGLVALGLGIVTGVVARSTTNTIESHCPNDACPSNYDLDGNRSSAKRFATIADVSFVAGGVLLAGALVWFAVLPRNASTTTAARWAPSAMCTGTGCGISLQRGF